MKEEAMPRDRGDRRVPGITYLDDVRTPADQLVLRLTDEVYSEVADLLDTVQRLYQERAGMRSFQDLRHRLPAVGTRYLFRGYPADSLSVERFA